MGSRHAAKAPEPGASSKNPKVRVRRDPPPSSLLFSPSVLGLSGASLSLVVGVAPSNELTGLLGSLPLLPELNLRANMGPSPQESMAAQRNLKSEVILEIILDPE